MTPPLRTVIADDHALFRVGLKQLVEEIPGLEFVGEAEDGEQLLSLMEQLSPDLLIIDHDMPGVSGLDVVTRLRSDRIQVKIILITGVAAEDLLADYVHLQIDGMILKTDDPVVLKDAFTTVRDGGKFLSEPIKALVERANVAKNLTSRERQVIRHLAKGLSNKEISRVMGIAPKTVDTHRTNLMHKLDLHNVAEVVAFAVKSGLT